MRAASEKGRVVSEKCGRFRGKAGVFGEMRAVSGKGGCFRRNAGVFGERRAFSEKGGGSPLDHSSGQQHGAVALGCSFYSDSVTSQGSWPLTAPRYFNMR